MGKDKYIKVIHNLLKYFSIIRMAHFKKIYNIINLDTGNYYLL